jgi:hypothetical protein
MLPPAVSPESRPRYLLLGLVPWKAALLLIPCAFCVWVAVLTVGLAESRDQVQGGLLVATHFSAMDDLLRREANPLDTGLTPAAVENSWPVIRAQFDSAQRILEHDAPLSEIMEPFVDQLRVVAMNLDSINRALPSRRAAGPVRDALLSRVRVLNARASDLLAATRERLRAQLAKLVIKVGRRWSALALIAVVSVVLAIANTLLLVAYGRSLAGGRRLSIDLRQSRAKIKDLERMLPICSHCKRLRDDAEARKEVELYVSQHPHTMFNLGVCPSCYAAYGTPGSKHLVRDEPGVA